MASPAAILHITAAEGGGTDRYIRDLAAVTRGRHWIWHASAGLEVIEVVAEQRFFTPRDAGALVRWIQGNGVGIIHVHGTTPDCTSRLGQALRARALPYVVSLHDVSFIAPGAFATSGMPAADPAWIASLQDFLHGAAAVIAPSDFIRDLATAHFAHLAVSTIPPGYSPPAPVPAPLVPAAFGKPVPAHVVAVVGAVGPHKGSHLLPAIAAKLARSGAALVVVGYTDTHITRGWIVPGELYIHGPYEDAALPGWLAAYRADCVLFPNRLPESFSYTLSEAWAAGLPVIVPDEGALGERVAQSGGGWRLPPGFGAAEAAELLARLWSPDGAAEWAQVKSGIAPGDNARVPTLAAMARDFDLLYARFSAPLEPGTASAPDALMPLVAANLEGFAFRRELVNLADELGRAKNALAEAMPWVAKLERDIAETRAWAQKLEHDVAVLNANLAASVAETRRLTDISDALRMLPPFMRRVLVKFRARR